MPMNKVPTLLVGLGGIGCSIADMVSSLLSAEDRAYVGVIGIDTNVEDLQKLKIKYICTSDERLVKDYLIERPEYRKWFPVNKFIVNKGMSTGAGQIRAISRLAGLASQQAGRFIPMTEEIKRILKQTKDKVRSFKLPAIPKNYYVEMSEAMEAIDELIKALDKRPISIKVLNLRVDTARDLVLKVYNTINETVKTARMAEAAIVYGNRYRVTNKEVDFGLAKAENMFSKGNFKNSLENAINAINIVEPGIYKRLLEEYK